MNQKSQLFQEFFQLVSQEDIEMAMPLVTKVVFAKGDLLLKKGEVCSHLYFLAKGVTLNSTFENGKANVVHVSFAGEFSTALYSFYSRLPSEVNIEALTDTEAFGIGYEAVQSLFNQSKNWERTGRVFAERAFIQAIRSKYDIQHKTAHQRYQELIDERPNILQLLSLGQIANILGISQETLSRIRGKR